MTESNSGSDSTSEWRFDTDEVGPDAESEGHIEPGTPGVENVAFVLLGVLFTLFVIWRLFAATF